MRRKESQVKKKKDATAKTERGLKFQRALTVELLVHVPVQQQRPRPTIRPLPRDDKEKQIRPKHSEQRNGKGNVKTQRKKNRKSLTSLDPEAVQICSWCRSSLNNNKKEFCVRRTAISVLREREVLLALQLFPRSLRLSSAALTLTLKTKKP